MAVNPFKYGCIVGGENYCRRQALQRQLQELLKSGQNVVIQGARRMGKTSLVCETVKSLRGCKLVYVDFFCVKSEGEFCRRVVSAVLKCGDGRSFLEKVGGLVKSLRPVFTVDKDSGAPTLSIDVKAAKGVESVEEVVEMIAQLSKTLKLCVIFDEFQDVADIPDADVILAALRSRIQFLDEVPFVFLGSVRNRMHAIFDSPKSPFFKSAISFGVEAIDETDLAAFVVARFKAGNRIIDMDGARRMIQMADGISGDVQELGEAIWLSTADGATLKSTDLDKGLEMVFARESRAFGMAVSRLTAMQLSVLKGLARSPQAKVFSAEFMQENELRSVGGLTKALKRLVADELIYDYLGDYRFENPFFREWVKRM